MDLTRAYEVLAKEMDLKPGDTVKVLRSARSYELGWQNTWTPSMTGSIGKIMEVVTGDEFGAKLSDQLSYPFFVLEVMYRAPVVEVTLDGRIVPLDSLSYETIKDIMK